MTATYSIQSGNIYICNMKVMEDLQPRAGCYSYGPMCLLRVNSLKQLVPIAIQLKQKADPDVNPVYYPKDGDAWTLAKIYYQAAHAQVRGGYGRERRS